MSPSEQLRDAPLVFHGGIVFQNLIPLIDLISVAMDEGRLCGRFEDRERLFQKGGLPQIVLIEKGQKMALGKVRARIPCRGLSAVLRVAHIADVCNFLQQRTGVVGRCIVHDDDFGGRKGLRAYGINGLLQISGAAVVGGNDDADMSHNDEFLGAVNR